MTLLEQYGLEWSIAEDYSTKIYILRSWSINIQKLILNKKIRGNRKNLKKVRKFYLKSSSICRWEYLRKVSPDSTVGIIRSAYMRCRGLV